MDKRVFIPAGATAADILDVSCDPILRRHARVWLHGVDVTEIEGFHAQAGDRFTVALSPMGGGGDGGGKSALGMILMVVVAVFAWYVAPAVFGGAGVGYGSAGWAAAGAAGTSTWATVGAYAINMIGSMAISALIAPSKISTNSGTDSSTGPQSYSITGQSNQARPFGSVLRLYGRHRVMPFQAANPVIDNVGTSSAFSQLFDFGFGNIKIDESTMQIGDVPLSQYAPTYYIYQDVLKPQLKLVTNRFGFDQYSINLLAGQPFTIRTKPDTNQAQVTIAFPGGLVQYDNQGGTAATGVQFRLLWRQLGTTEWQAGGLSFAGAGYQVPGVGAAIDHGVVLVMAGQQTARTDFQVSMSTNTGAPVNAVGNQPTLTAAIAAAGGVWNEYHNGNHDYASSIQFRPVLKSTLNPAKNYVGRMTYASADGSYFAAMTGAIKTGDGNYIGQFYAEDNGSYRNNSGSLRINLMEYEPAGYFIVRDMKQSGFNFVTTINFPGAAQYEIQIVRNTANSSDTKLRNDSALTMLESRVAGDVLKLQSPHTLMEMRVVATDKLNGIVQTLSAIGTSVLRMTTDGVNFTYAPSRNPAWVCLDIMQGAATVKKLPDAQIDWQSWIALAAYCDEQVTRVVNGQSITQARHTCDVVIDYEVNVGDLIDSILSACHSSKMITRGGKYGVLIDIEKTVPRQILTPQNSWGFTGSRMFIDIPDALRVSYIDGDKFAGSGYETWGPSEIVVYRDGFDSSNAQVFENLGTFGITDYAAAWSAGRYTLAQGIFRNEIFSVSMDVENLACARGDLIQLAHDVPRVGGISSHVTNVAGNDITITEKLSQLPEGYSVRLISGEIRTGMVTAMVTESIFTLDNATGINEGDLIVLGKLDRVTGDYLVQTIAPGPDLTASLSVLRYVPEVYTADTGALPEYFPDFGDDFINATDLVVINLQASPQITTYINRAPYGQFNLTWQTQGFQAGYFEILATFANGQTELIQNVQQMHYEYLIALLDFSQRAGPVIFTVTPFTSSGVMGTPASASSEVVLDTSAPGEVPGFGLDTQDMTIQLFWQLSSEPDIAYYTLRYSPDVDIGTWATSQVIATVDHITSRVSVGARTGRYFIRAIDTSGNAGAVSSRRTTIEALPNINVVETMNDATTWTGAKSGVVLDGKSIISAGDFGNVNPLGYYNYSDTIDLGDVCEVRVSSKIQGYGLRFDDFMSEWVPLASVNPMASALADEWNIQLEIRVIDQVVFMAQWSPLSNPIANPIAGGSGLWSNWRPIEVGDVTGRYLQFRVRVESFDPNVKAVLSNGLIEIDAPDRTLKAQNVLIPSGGIRIYFAPAFMFRPTVAITIDNATQTLAYQISNIDRYGFNIELRDAATDAPAAGVIDWAALGNGKLRATVLNRRAKS